MDTSTVTMSIPQSMLASRTIGRRAFLRSFGGAALAIWGCGNQKQKLSEMPKGSSAERAVHAARRFAGTSLSVGWETGPQAYGFTQLVVPIWEKLTGVRINVVEMGWPLDQFRRIAAEHRAGTHAMDCASIAPSWLPDLLADGALEKLDDYVADYLPPGDLDDYLPLYRTQGFSGGHQYGFFDDGDTLLLFYRQDLFEDPANRKDFAAKYGYPLADPRNFNWHQFIDTARFFTEKYAPDLYGVAPLTRELVWACFQYRLRVEGGQFFDSVSMKPAVDSPAGMRALVQVLEATRMTPPMGAMETLLPTSLASYLSGKAAMAISWPPLGRLAELHTPHTNSFSLLPRSQVGGKTGYALLPDGLTEMAVGFVLSVLAHSKHKEAAYLFIQWLSSPEISLQRVERLDTLRDPYRFSHVRAPDFRALWPQAGEYLDMLEKAASGAALLDLMIFSTHEYQEAFYEMVTRIRLGTPVEAALKQLAQAWDQITERRGRSYQRRAYADFLKRPGAMIPTPIKASERQVSR